MKHLLLAALALLALAPPVRPQDTDDGSKAALKGVKKIYVDTGQDKTERLRIFKVLKDNAEKPAGLVLVHNAADAEVVLAYTFFRGGTATRNPWGLGDGRPTTLTRHPHKVPLAIGSVIALGKMRGSRELLKFDSSRGRLVGWPSEQFAKAFVKAWVKANK